MILIMACNRLGLTSFQGLRCFSEQETLPHCLVLVGTRNEFKREFTIKLK